MRRFFIAMLALLLFAGAADAKTLKIGIVAFQMSSETHARAANAADAAAKALGWSVTLLNSRGSIPESAAQIENLIAAKVDALVLCMSKPVELDAQMAAAKAAGIAVVTIASGTSPHTLTDIQANEYQVGSDATLHLLGLPGAAAVIALAQTAGDTAPLLFLPALIGTRAPHWQPHARGALLGLDAAHGPADIALAVLEAIAFADRDLMGDLDFTRLTLAGGGARADFACQLRADVLGRAVHRIAGEPGLTGAAVLAWTGLGAYPCVAGAQAKMCRHDSIFEPSPRPRLDRLYSAFTRAQEATTLLADPR